MLNARVKERDEAQSRAKEGKTTGQQNGETDRHQKRMPVEERRVFSQKRPRKVRKEAKGGDARRVRKNQGQGAADPHS